MAKRLSRQNVSRSESQAQRREGATVRALFPEGMPEEGGWSPLGEDREQRYVRNVRPKSANQKALMAAIDESNVVLALGPAGTGKTYLAIAKAVEAFEAGRVGRIMLSRPAVEAGETLGFLPGD